MKCPKCRGELQRSKKDPSYGLCYNCKKKYKLQEEPFVMNTVTNTATKTDTKVDEKKNTNILLWVLLVILPPIGILYLWLRKRSFTTKKKATLTVIFSVWFLIVMLMPQEDKSEKVNNPEPPKAEQESPSEDESLAKELGVDVALITNIKQACESVGIEPGKMKIESASNDGTACIAQVSYEGYLFDVTGNADNTITYIGSGDIPFLQNGNVQNVNDRLPTSSQVATLTVQAEEDVKANLKAPSTAEFPGRVLESDQWTVNKNGDTYTVIAWVDAQNSFGAQIRSNFVATYNWDGSDNTQPQLISVNIEE